MNDLDYQENDLKSLSGSHCSQNAHKDSAMISSFFSDKKEKYFVPVEVTIPCIRVQCAHHL